MQKILLIEDSKEWQLIVNQALNKLDIELVVLSTVQDCLALKSLPFDLVLLDLSLPDGDGLSIVEDLRSKNRNLPIFLLTGNDEVSSKVAAFNLGADDYLTKSISPLELRARVEARLRKGQVNSGDVLVRGPIKMNLALMKAWIVQEGGDLELSLTAKELKILCLLARHPGRVYSRPDLVREIWGETTHVLKRTVDSHIYGLRRKLGASSGYIQSVQGAGYRFKDD